MTCDRCDGLIETGDVHYLVEISLTADMDPTHLGGLSSDALSDGLQRALDAAASLSEAEAMASVHEKRAFVLCGPCRDAYRANPLARPLPGASGLIH